MERSSRTRLATAGILVVVFGAGAFFGMALDSTDVANPPESDVAQQQEQEGERRRRRYIYEQVIDPTEAKQVTIDSALGTWRRSLRELNAEYRPRFDSLEEAYDMRRDSLREELRRGIMALMTPAQAEEYRRLLAEYDRRQAERRERDNK